jgi:hypothetical protein
MKSYTPKTQELARQRKELTEKYGRFEQYAPLLEALDEDPKETIIRLAKMHDVPLASADNDTKAGNGSGDMVKEQTSRMAQQLQDLFGPENSELAKSMAQIFEGNMRELESNIRKDVDPLKTQYQTIAERSAAEAAERDMQAFEQRHPDWKQYEPKIVELGKKLEPKGMSVGDYMDLLYTLASAGKKSADTTTEVVNRLKQAAESAEEPTQGVKDTNVTPSAPPKPTMQQAFEAAKKGIRWET